MRDVFTKAMNCLSEEDRCLPQVDCTLKFLVKGIGIHHGGLLPIIKEVTELLFSEGLIKVKIRLKTISIISWSCPDRSCLPLRRLRWALTCLPIPSSSPVSASLMARTFVGLEFADWDQRPAINDDFVTTGDRW